MSSDMLTIAASGTRAARAALDVTAQNIANASTEGYVRRSVTLADLSSPNARASYGDVSQFGVRVVGISRNVDSFLQAEARRTGSDATRADTLVTGLGNLNNAVEQSNLYPAITSFLSSLSQLSSAPTDSALRASTLESARNMAQNFNTASTSLASAQAGLQFEATDNVSQVNTLATSLAQLNLKIASDTNPQNNQATLLDQRDTILQQLSQYGDITTSIAANNTVAVQMGGASGPQLVSGGSANTLAMATAANGTLSFTLGGSSMVLSGGSLAGHQQALTTAASATTTLDGIANALISAANTAQGNGVNLAGTTGQPLFSGSGAGGMTLALASATGLATAPAGAGANSQNPANLTALQTALATTDIAGQTSSLIFSLSSAVNSNTTTRDALDAISSNAKTALATQSGVSLDTEAANLLRYQQAFQASGKVMQVASTLFDTLMGIR